MPYNFAKEEKDLEKLYKKFGARVRELRLENGWSQDDMSQHGFSKRHLQKIEAGKPIQLSTAYRFAKAFGMSLSELTKDL